MNFVFLDIDGVLNNLGTVAAYGNPSKYFDPVSVRLIEKLCENGNAGIVVSSSWRNGDTEKIRKQLHGLASPELASLVISETPDLYQMSRGREIQTWLDEHASSQQRYVILDDDDDMLEHQKFVKTTFEDGFRFRHYVDALRYLNPEHKDCTRRITPVTAQPERETE